MSTFKKNIHLGTIDPLYGTEDIADKAITEAKLSTELQKELAQRAEVSKDYVDNLVATEASAREAADAGKADKENGKALIDSAVAGHLVWDASTEGLFTDTGIRTDGDIVTTCDVRADGDIVDGEGNVLSKKTDKATTLDGYGITDGARKIDISQYLSTAAGAIPLGATYYNSASQYQVLHYKVGVVKLNKDDRATLRLVFCGIHNASSPSMGNTYYVFKVNSSGFTYETTLDSSTVYQDILDLFGEYIDATSSVHGLMSASDKKKLNNIPAELVIPIVMSDGVPAVEKDADGNPVVSYDEAIDALSSRTRVSFMLDDVGEYYYCGSVLAFKGQNIIFAYLGSGDLSIKYETGDKLTVSGQGI